MKRILVFGMNQNPGGVESFIMNYFREFNREKLALDFLCNSNDKIAYEDELISKGARVFHLTARSKNPVRYYWEMYRFFKKYASDYQAIWVNINSLANIDYLKFARYFGIPVRIVHSHNSQNMDTKLREKLHNHNRDRIEKWATDFWACSHEAAKWFYNQETIGKVKIILNAINMNASIFSSEARDKIRTDYTLDNKFVLGHVGRLHFQKNQEFMIRVLAKLQEFRNDVCLVLVGQGEDLDKLKLLAEELSVQDKVYFVGVQSNISEWLSAFDLFFFPSKFEGLPLAPLEAQANGLPILLSEEAMPQEAKINENIFYYSLKADEERWAKFLDEMIRTTTRLDYEDIRDNFEKSGYDIKIAAQNLEKQLLELV